MSRENTLRPRRGLRLLRKLGISRPSDLRPQAPSQRFGTQIASYLPSTPLSATPVPLRNHACRIRGKRSSQTAGRNDMNIFLKTSRGLLWTATATLLFVLAAILAPKATLAQADLGSVNGTVTDV